MQADRRREGDELVQPAPSKTVSTESLRVSRPAKRSAPSVPPSPRYRAPEATRNARATASHLAKADARCSPTVKSRRASSCAPMKAKTFALIEGRSGSIASPPQSCRRSRSRWGSHRIANITAWRKRPNAAISLAAHTELSPKRLVRRRQVAAKRLTMNNSAAKWTTASLADEIASRPRSCRQNRG
jgi:hypothetical protein